ncbi:hypothetical protein DYBT9275_02713 [Dyadobacter sp. CECT 9275]|uniref:Uncharacterized protein n=1 Tax=Dyadobacter helix TaxID=2822344 RepID=A0A916JCP7_9BACT|nr:hypothetical protein DYBT9275_02713 [Dyadobacter sp. CECT 9275]
MWILPNNHPLSSHFAQEYAESNEDLKEYFDQSELPLMWKSKPLSWKTFLRQWKRVWWMQHLSGRILKPSTRIRFETALMESLEVILVNHLALQETETGFRIQDTFGRLYTRSLSKAGRHGASLKTSEGTYQWDIQKFTETYGIWVTVLSQESIQRKKSALRTKGIDYSSLPLWKTPLSSENEGGVLEIRSGTNAKIKLRDQSVHWGTPLASDHGGTTREDFSPKLSEQIQNFPTPISSPWKSGHSNLNRKNAPPLSEVVLKNWPTPITSRGDYQNQKNGERAPKLNGAVTNWPTPVTMDKMAPKTDKALIREKVEIRPGRASFSNLRDSVISGSMTDFQPDKVNINTTGKSRARLNPAWSIQLMGTTLQKIFTVPLAIQWLNKPQK